MATSASDVWPEILTSLREDLPDQTVKNWFESASPEVEGSDPLVFCLLVPGTFHRDHIREQYYSIFRSAVQEAFGQEIEIQLRVDEELDGEQEKSTSPKPTRGGAPERPEKAASHDVSRRQLTSGRTPSQQRSVKQSSGRSASTTEGNPASTSPQTQKDRPESNPREFHRSTVRVNLKARYTFENFVEGDANALARNASAAVAENPGGTNYNPLLIYGGVGLGKTHLAQAIANHATARETAEFVCYKSGEEFTSEFIQAIRNGEGGKFSQKYKGVDILILDDIQFFEGKEKTQEEFFHLFNALYQQNKQIVLCADRPPKEIPGIEDRLLSRFEWGLSTDVQQPTFETRLAILQLKAEVMGLEIEKEVLDLMAESITTNIRELEGALKQLSARANLMGEKVDADTARRFLKDQVKLPESTPVSLEDILSAVTEWYDIQHDELVGRSRRKDVVHPRHVAMYLCREFTSLSLEAIGLRFGGRDHSTVSHAREKVSDRLDVQPELEEELNDVKRLVHRYAAQ